MIHNRVRCRATVLPVATCGRDTWSSILREESKVEYAGNRSAEEDIWTNRWRRSINTLFRLENMKKVGLLEDPGVNGWAVLTF